MAEINYENGEKYSGEELNGVRNGFGTYTYADGSFYKGEYVKDKMEGWGTYSFLNGDIHVGEWENDKEDGQGTFTWGPKSDFAGDKYEGAFKKGVKSGYGTYYWSNGDMFEGYWENDKQNGLGTYTYNNGEVTSGEWKNGEQISVSDSPKNINAEPKERVNNNNREKTLVIKQVVWDDNVGFETGLPANHFTISDMSDLGEQWDTWYLQEFFKSTFFAELDGDAMPIARFWIYKNIEDAQKATADDAWSGDDKGLPFAWDFYIPNKDEFKGFGNIYYYPGWNDMKEQLQEVVNKKVIQYWGLEELINNPPQQFQEYNAHELSDSLIKIYIGLVNDKPKKGTSETKETENINISKQKTLTVQLEQYDSSKKPKLYLGMKYFHAVSFEDLKIQIIDYYVYLIETGSLTSRSTGSGQKNIAVDTKSGGDVADLKVYKKIFDVEKNEHRHVTLPLCNSILFYPPNEISFKGAKSDYPQWDVYLDDYNIEDNDFELFGLNNFKSNFPKKLLGVYDEEFLTLLFEIYKKASHDENWENEEQIKESESPKTLTAETKKVENITTNVDKASGFQWEKIYNTEEMIALQAREEVFNYIFQYYKVEDVDDLTKKQINEIIKFRDQELSEFSNLKSGFNDLIGMWES